MAMRNQGITRAEFLKTAALGPAALAAVLANADIRADEAKLEPQAGPKITVDDLKAFAKIAGLQFTDAELAKVQEGIDENVGLYTALRKDTADYDLMPSAPFRASGAEDLRSAKVEARAARRSLKRPANEEDLAFLPLADLAYLVKTKQVAGLELTELAIRRLKRFGPKLFCVAALTEERAIRKAKEADREIEQGNYRGPLHGIPCGVKDLFAAKGYPTQWGTEAFRGQVIDKDAAVVERLDEAGAVLVAKLSLGALAMDDKWYGGQTKNPWKPNQGSSGSSAGSASAVSAGLLPFAIGTETSGSIVSPSHRCRVTGLRPTFGSISRYGAMALCWSLDKVGILSRTAEDAALVFSCLVGYDPRDVCTLRRPFSYRPAKDLKGVKIGVLGRPSARAKQALEELGAKATTVQAPEMDPGLWLILQVESAAMFDEITRNGRLNLVKENGWPEYWRSGRFVPAVEYAQAERARTLLMRAFDKAFGAYDFILLADHGGELIYPCNLTGWPQILVPMGADLKGVETGVSLLAKPFDEGRLLAAAYLLQQRLPYYKERPDLKPFE